VRVCACVSVLVCLCVSVSVYICACSLNDDCSRLLVGYARGQLTMWDLTTGKLLRTITDAHSPGVAVLSVRFTDDKTVAVMSDSGGSVFRLEFKRLIGLRTCDSQCLFSGSRGEVRQHCVSQSTTVAVDIFEPGGQDPKSHSSCSSCCCYQFSKYRYGFLSMQQSTTKLCIHIRSDISHRSTVSDFPLIL